MSESFDLEQMEVFAVTSALEEKAWSLTAQLEETLRTLLRFDATDARRAINDVCDSIAKLAAESSEGPTQ